MYSRYDLTAREAARLGIRPLEYVEVEDPDFANEARHIPSGLENYIEGYDLVWTLTIEQSYAEQRRWDEFISFREFIQNALDEEHVVYGYDNISISVETDSLGTWVKDRGRGINYRAFMLGAHEKPCYTRGYFGEGLKVAALWFTTNIGDVYIFTKDIVYRCYYSRLADALVIVFGRSKIYADGTWVLIHRWWPDEEEIKKIYFKTAGFEVLFRKDSPSDDCPHEMPNMILAPGGEKSCLYVRDIYVNEFLNLFTKPALYSYNLWWVNLEPNRRQVESTRELEEEIARLLTSSPKHLVRLLEEVVMEGEHGGTKYFYIESKYFEVNIPWYIGVDELDDYEKEELLEEVKRFCYEKGITAWETGHDYEAVVATGHEGGVCLLIPSEMEPLFKKVPKATKFVALSLLKTTEGEIVDEKYMDINKRRYLALYRLITDKITPGVKVVAYTGKRNYYDATEKVIFVSVEHIQWFEDFIHELAHAYGFAIYGTAPDVSENFEKAFSKVGARLLDMTMYDESTRLAMKRIMLHCIYASPKGMYEFYPFDTYKLRYAKEIMEDPFLFIVVLDNEIVGFVAMSSIRGIPFEDTYRKTLEEGIEKIKEIVRIIYKEKRFLTPEEITALPQYLQMLADTLYRNKEKIRNICYYDLFEDKYKEIELWRVLE
jgi:hypothetical protein